MPQFTASRRCIHLFFSPRDIPTTSLKSISSYSTLQHKTLPLQYFVLSYDTLPSRHIVQHHLTLPELYHEALHHCFIKHHYTKTILCTISAHSTRPSQCVIPPNNTTTPLHTTLLYQCSTYFTDLFWKRYPQQL